MSCQNQSTTNVSSNSGCCHTHCQNRGGSGFVILIVLYILLAIILGTSLVF